MLDKYEKLQPVFYNYIMSSFQNDKISHAYLIETSGVIYGLDLAIDLAKFFLCNGVYEKSICDSVDNNTCFNFKIIDSDKEIKKDDILDLKNSFSVKSDNRMVYLIKDASKLNKSSANSLLKFLEEPEDGIVAILLVDNIGKVIETISSRCQIINLINFDAFDYKSIFSYYDCAEHGDFDTFVGEQISLFFDFYKQLENIGCEMLSNANFYDYGINFKSLLMFGFYLYSDLMYYKLDINKKNLIDLDLSDFCKNVQINDIIKKIDVINDFMYKFSFNVNLNLFMDNFVISMKGVNL